MGTRVKKSEFVKQVLSNKNNTVFTTEEQVLQALKVFQDLGMIPPSPEPMEEVTKRIYYYRTLEPEERTYDETSITNYDQVIDTKIFWEKE